MHIESHNRIARFCALFVSVALLAGTAMGGNVVSSGSGDWHDPLTWGGTAVTAADDVFVAATHTVTIYGNGVTNINSLSVSGTLEHAANTTTEANKINLDIANNCTIASGGAIDVSEKGYDSGNGPSQSTGRGGVGYGGEGGLGYQSGGNKGVTYGSITNPVNCGSSPNWYGHEGGGVVILTAGGALTVDGTIAANGESGTTPGDGGAGAAGGSVNLTAPTLSGSGTITAHGGDGDGNAGGGGGGGRIAIRLTQAGATFDSFGTSDILAYGGDGAPNYGTENAAAGTVYLINSTDQTYGDLIVDNNDWSTTSFTMFTNGTYRFASITVTNSGSFAPGGDATLDLSGCTLTSDSTTNSITSRLVLGQGNSSITWPSALTLAGTISCSGTDQIAATTDLTIGSGGILTHELGGTSTENNIIDLAITGSVTIDSGGAIYTVGRGYLDYSGPGKPSGGRGGGGHGGEGGDGYQTATIGASYGSVVNPVTYGSGGVFGQNQSGGGVAILTVSGGLTNNGVIAVDGESAAEGNDDGGGGAAGSINLTVASLSGSGVISANGGKGDKNAGGGGAGGRIAISLTQSGATFDSFGTANISAYGGALKGAAGGTGEKPGGAGTIYLKTADQSYGDLIIDADLDTTSDTPITNAGAVAVNDVILKNYASVEVGSEASLSVYGSWSNAAPTNVLSGDGVVEFMGSVTGTVYGSTVFANFVCTNLAKTLVFEAGMINTMTSSAKMQGVADADGSRLKLRSTQEDTQWNLHVLSGVASEDKLFEFVDAQDSDARSPGTAISAVSSKDSGNNSNWVFGATGQTNVWHGAAGTSWSAAGNWSLGYAPTTDDSKVVISNGAPDYPVLSGDVLINAFEMEAGTTLQLSNQDLTLNGIGTIAGTITASGSETVTFKSNAVFTGAGSLTPAQSTVKLAATGPQSLTTLGNTFHILEITNTAAVTVTDAFTADTIDLSATSANVTFQGGFMVDDVDAVLSAGGTLTFTAGQTYTVNDHLHLRGTSGNEVTVTGAGVWNLDMNGYSSVRYVNASNSDASGGNTIFAMESTDGTGNVNWNFTAGKMWVGTTDAWSTAGNWSPSGVPGATSHVLIDGVASTMPKVTSGTTVAGLTVVGIGGAATLTVDMPIAGPDQLTVSGHAAIGTNATLTHTANGAAQSQRLSLNVATNLTIETGGAIDVSSRGYDGSKGPGRQKAGRSGGGHGGEGGAGYQAGGLRGTTYGSVVNPVNLGSGGLNRSGGGAILVTAGGALTVHGTIAADGEECDADIAGGGAGGSVNLTAATLSGNGVIRADGGDDTYGNAGGGGGGGRVAVRLTQAGATFDSFGEQNITAYGGDLKNTSNYGEEDGAAGTVYLETQAQGSGGGTVRIDNFPLIGDNPDTTGADTHIPAFSNAVLAELTGAMLILTNRGTAASTTNVTIGNLLVYTNSDWVLGSWTVTVGVAEHSLEDLSSPDPDYSTNRVDNYDQIIWDTPPGGPVFILR